jgi:hypothetical protein
MRRFSTEDRAKVRRREAWGTLPARGQATFVTEPITQMEDCPMQWASNRTSQRALSGQPTSASRFGDSGTCQKEHPENRDTDKSVKNCCLTPSFLVAVERNDRGRAAGERDRAIRHYRLWV